MKHLSQKNIFILLSLFIVSSCAGDKEAKKSLVFGNKNYADSFVSDIKPRWFKTSKRFKLVDRNKEAVPHRFFDINPFRSEALGTINTIVVTPEGSKFLNQIDLSSGQIYTDKKFCPQEDEYKEISSSVIEPNFSIGILPRVLDQLNMPQRVAIFGGKEYIQKNYLTHYFDVRVIGGFIEQICPSGGCFKSDQWLSRLVLIGVQNQNKEYKKIKSIKDLEKKVDWKYFKAFVQNGEGKNVIADKFFPRKRMGAIIGAKQSLNYINKNSTIFTIDKLKEMRSSCYKLYDFLWKDLSYINTGAREATTKEEIRKKALDLQAKRKAGKRDISFVRRYTKNFKKFNTQYKTCSKFIYPSSVNDDIKRHWFFSYLTAFHHLHDLGYAYNCRTKIWNINPVISKGRRIRSLQEQFANCSDSDLDRAFEYAPKVLDSLRQKSRLSYRYIDYDRGRDGTHLKLYSWVKQKAALMSCSNKEDREFGMNKDIFPLDIPWSKRGNKTNKNRKKNQIIY